MARYKDMPALDLVGKWLSEYLPETRRLAEGTIDSYEQTFQILHSYLLETGGANSDPKLKKKGLRAARVSHLDGANLAGFAKWLRESRGNKSNTVEQRLAAIRSFLEYAVTINLSYSALLVQAQKLKIGKKDPVKLVGHMSLEAWDVLVAQPKLPKRTEWRNWVFMVLMYEIGGRNGEIIGLRVKDLVLDGDDPKVYVWGKGNKEGVTPIRDSVVQILKEYVEAFHPGRKNSEDPLFYIRRKGAKAPLSPDCSEAFLKRYGEAARKICPAVPERVHPHLIRHTRSMHLKDEGMSDEDLAKFLRHSGLGTVKVYAQASSKVKRKALDKANGKDPGAPSPRGSWEGNEDLILRLRNP